RGDGLRIWPDEYDPCGGESLCECLALREKAIAGMDRLGAAVPAGGDDFLDHQIAFGGGRRPDRDGTVRHLHVQGILVGLRIDGDRPNSHLSRGLYDPAGDFAAIGDQDTLEHAVSVTPDAGHFACGVTMKKSIARRRPCDPGDCYTSVLE